MALMDPYPPLFYTPYPGLTATLTAKYTHLPQANDSVCRISTAIITNRFGSIRDEALNFSLYNSHFMHYGTSFFFVLSWTISRRPYDNHRSFFFL